MDKNNGNKMKATELERPSNRLDTTTPFSVVRRFTEDMERFFEDVQGFRFGSLLGREFFPFTKELEHVDWVPKIEVWRNNEELRVRADLPGLKKEDVKLEVTTEALMLSGERKEEKEEKREGYFRSERNYGSFYRYIPLPEGVKTDTVTAQFRDGVLEVAMQVPTTKTTGRRVEITEGAMPVAAKAAATATK